MREAELQDTDTGTVVGSEGWFIVNVADIRWHRIERMGAWCTFEHLGTPQQVGVGVHVLWPGDTPGHYHWESDQEGFLVLEGECIAVVDGEERRMRQWDYLHSPPGTAHITIGAGDGPCALLMLGARTPGAVTEYQPDPVAASHGAAVARTTHSAEEAYADRDRTRTPVRAPWPRA